ncbi:hypothetical protein [Paeniglutamicibacter terrestris]|uniref:Uncharacterized protein n=1 Tax=Paeniglutamicibacter terrestris TaxID=2723403 RepID=A0ABX1FZ43_9MICC|nr:hypothetical protein [Paeniglutamicibacter terrestris]NKG19213.1 hypothetical protein [Paeniglutamicibacter terrestris]
METVHAKAQGSQPDHTPKTVIGPLTARDVVVLLGGLLVLVGSFLPIPWSKTVAVNMWIFPGLPFHFFVSVLLPLAIAAGFLWRRLQGHSRVRVGSLSLDQAASVVAIIASAYFLNSYVASMAPAYLIGLFGGLAMVAGTTLASYLGAFRGDFVSGGESVLGSDVYPVPMTKKENKDAAAAAVATDDHEEFIGASSTGDYHAPSVPRTSHSSTATSDDAHSDDAHADHAHAVVDVDSHVEADPVAKVVTPVPAVKAPVVVAPTSTSASAAATDSSAADADETTPAESDNVLSEAEVADPKAKSAVAASAAENDAKLKAPTTGTEAARETQLKDVPAVKGETSDARATSAVSNDESASAGSPATEQKQSTKLDDVDVDAVAVNDAKNTTDVKGSEAPQSAGAARLTESEAPKETATDSPHAGAEESDKPAASLTATSAAQSPVAKTTTSGTEAKVPTPGATSGVKPAAQQSAAAHPATSLSPAAPVDIKATAALSRADIQAHQEAAEKAKARAAAESEQGFGARAEVHEPEEKHTSFWFALNAPRPVFHPGNGKQLTMMQPGTWILCLEDRGTEYLINQANGTPAVLRNLDDLQFPEK